jgi:hypothetical protein
MQKQKANSSKREEKHSLGFVLLMFGKREKNYDWFIFMFGTKEKEPKNKKNKK